MKSIILKSKSGKRFKQGHPWVFSNELEKPADRPDAGDIVALRQQDGTFLAYGFYHPHSLIAFRALTGNEQEPDRAVFFRTARSGHSAEKQVYPDSNARRLVHSESDGLPGLIVDQFDNVLSVQVNSAGMESNIDLVLNLLNEKLSPAVIVTRNDSSLRKLEGLPQYTGIWQSDADNRKSGR